ncbi:MAG TPA: hypothetical protein IAD33_00020 [Candidatus Scatomorpha gallistercoris]|nr:hypothetical protein [Candidatus Scatomorpha gallistercoris]
MSDKFKEAKYDERQTAVRGRAFKYAYGTLLVALLFYAASDDIWNWCVPLTGCAAAIAVSLVPYVWVSIMNEAYWWANTKRIGQYVTFALLGLMNLGLALSSWLRGDLIVDGVLQIGGANLVLGSVFIYIFVIAMIQRARLRRDGDED